MIPGLGAAVRLTRGVHQKKQIESRIAELTRLNTTPAVDEYTGLQRFEVATVICDAQLGLVLDGKAGKRSVREECDHYLDVMEREYEMVLEEAASAPATKAEVFALGLALKEVALSFDEISAEFTTSSERQLARLKQELANNRKQSAEAMAGFARSAQETLDGIRESGRGTLAELDERAATRLAELDQEIRNRLGSIDASLERGMRETTAMMDGMRASAAAMVDQVEQRMQAAVAAMEQDLTGQLRQVEASAAARAESAVGAGIRRLILVIIAVSVVLFGAAALLGQFLMR